MIRVCSVPGCPDPATHRGRCPAHATHQEQARNQNRTEQRRIYSSAKWRHTRQRQLFEHPLCACGSIATDVHHCQDLADNGNPWSPANLSSMCHTCHSRTTNQRQHKPSPTDGALRDGEPQAA